MNRYNLICSFFVDSDDAAVVSIRFSNGAIGSLILSEVSHGRNNRVSIEVSGTKKSIWWNLEVPYHLSNSHKFGGVLTQTNAYGGDPFFLILLYPDGSSEEVLMGCDPLKGQKVQFVIPANTWQAGSSVKGGRYSLFGCTMSPGFTSSAFEAGIAEELIKQYPERAEDIIRLGVNG